MFIGYAVIINNAQFAEKTKFIERRGSEFDKGFYLLYVSIIWHVCNSIN